MFNNLLLYFLEKEDLLHVKFDKKHKLIKVS
jgi:hypothetical protein